LNVLRRSETPTMCPNCHSTRPPDAAGDLVRCPAANCRALHEAGDRFVRASDCRGAVEEAAERIFASGILDEIAASDGGGGRDAMQDAVTIARLAFGGQ
jgi:hypothetical protein